MRTCSQLRGDVAASHCPLTLPARIQVLSVGALPLRLFIVEDSVSVAEALTEMLTSDGSCEVVGCATSEPEALVWSYQNEAGFDVAIVDLLLGRGSGFAVLAHLQKYQPGKTVVFSEFVSPSIEERCRSLGAKAAFPKSKPHECVAFVRSLARSH